MRPGTVILLFAIALVTCACDKTWPPYKRESVELFEKNRTKMEVLESRLAETEFVRVVQSSSKTVMMYEQYEGRMRPAEWLQGDEGAVWHEMLLDAQMVDVHLDEDGATFNVLGMFHDEPNTEGYAMYVHQPGEKAPGVECIDEFRDVGCGHCQFPVADGWWVEVSWWKETYDEVSREKRDNGLIPSDEYWARERKASDECFAEGAAIIGFPFEPIYDEGRERYP